MEKSPKASPSRMGSYYQVLPIKDHHEAATQDDEDTEEQTIYNDHEETESLVGNNSSTGTSSPRHHLSRASSVASSADEVTGVLGGESSMSNNNDKKNGEIDKQQVDNEDHHDDDDDDDDDEDDEFNLRRYHNFARPADSDRRTELTAGSSFWMIHHHWHELRQAAHQRRAARLLSMHNPESTISKATVCFVSTCCDATDVGIVVAAVAIFLWISIGVVLKLTFASYWLIGSFLLVLRFTGRRLMEMTVFRRRRLSDDPSTLARFRHSNHGRLPPPII